MSIAESIRRGRAPWLSALVVFAGAACLAAAPRAGAASPEAGAPSRLDPSEEMTQEELMTLPEPVPAAPEVLGGPAMRSPLPRSLWRVQVFATQDRDLADRTAREAAQLLRCRAYVDSEADHFKVRLGDFASEEDAGSLRDQALRSGYAGAFRIRCDTTLNKY